MYEYEGLRDLFFIMLYGEAQPCEIADTSPQIMK